MSSRQYPKSTTTQPEFYIYMDSDFSITFEILGDYKSVFICTQQT